MKYPDAHRERLLLIALPSWPLLAALCIIFLVPLMQDPLQRESPVLTRVNAPSAEALMRIFEREGFAWPPGETVPALGVTALPAGLETLEVEARKSLFFRTLLPLVVAENERIRRLRAQAQAIDQRLREAPEAELRSRDAALMERLIERYRIEGDWRESAVRERLLRRLDTVPPGLALAQAANESGWGTSHFARVANNLFGEWTWDESAGVLPRERADGATHFVRHFPDLQAAVRTYIWNLNVGHAYEELRALRARLDEPDGVALAAALTHYSERGDAYVSEIRSMMRQNRLDELPTQLELEPVYIAGTNAALR